MDKRTERRRSRTRLIKAYGLPVLAALVGVGARALLGFSAGETLIDALGPITRVAPGVKAWLTIDPLGQVVSDWVGPPLALFALARLLIASRPGRLVLDRLLPDFPAFARSDLEEYLRRTMVNLERGPPAFAGRASESATLAAMLVRAGAMPAFQWRFVSGPSGIGKTRLAVEWLRRASAEGWWAGIVDPGPRGRAALETWTAARPTALVIDEARADWKEELGQTIAALARGASTLHPVRLLVIDQIAPVVHLRDAAADDLVAAAALEELRLDGMDADSLDRIVDWRGHVRQSGALVHVSGGRPRAALLVARAPDVKTYAEAIARWAEALLPELAGRAGIPDRDVAVPLIYAAMVGPVDADAVRRQLPSYNERHVLRFFDATAQTGLRRIVPAFQPDDLGAELALRLLDALDAGSREAIGTDLVALEPERIEVRLGSLWRDRMQFTDLLDPADGDDAPEETVLEWLQRLFDEAQPTRVAAIHARAGAITTAISAVLEAPGLVESVDQLRDLSLSRPHDPVLACQWAQSTCYVIHRLAALNEWTEIDRQMTLLLEIVRVDPYASDEKVNAALAWALYEVVRVNSEAGRDADAVRWLDIVLALSEDEGVFWDDETLRHNSSAMGYGLIVAVRRGDGDALHRHLTAMSTAVLNMDGGQTAAVNTMLQWLSVAVDEKAARADHEHYDCLGEAATALVDELERWDDLDIRERVDTLFEHIMAGWTQLGEPDRAVEWFGRFEARFEARGPAGEMAGDPAALAATFRAYARGACNRAPRSERPDVAVAFDRLLSLARIIVPTDYDESLLLSAADAMVIALAEGGGPAEALEQLDTILRDSAWRERADGVMAGLWAASADRSANARDWIELPRSIEHMIRCVDAATASTPTLRRQEYTALSSAVHAYGQAGDITGMEEWQSVLQRRVALPHLSHDDHVQELAVAQLRCPALHHLAKGDVDSAERWMSLLVRRAYAGNDLREAAAMSIAAASSVMMTTLNAKGSNSSDRYAHWRSHLAYVARARPGDGRIQEIAGRFGLNLVGQQVAVAVRTRTG